MSAKQIGGDFSDNLLLDFLIKVRRFCTRNKKTIFIALFLIVAGAFFIVMRVIEARSAEEEASTAFERIVLMLQGGDARERIGDIDSQLEDIIRRWPGTLAAARASLQLGHLQYSLENYTAAIESYTRASRYSTSIMLFPAGLLGIANSYEQSGESEKAIEYYERVAALALDFGYRNIARIGWARCLGLTGKAGEARSLLESIISENAPFSEDAAQVLVWLDGIEEAPLVPPAE